MMPSNTTEGTQSTEVSHVNVSGSAFFRSRPHVVVALMLVMLCVPVVAYWIGIFFDLEYPYILTLRRARNGQAYDGAAALPVRVGI